MGRCGGRVRSIVVGGALLLLTLSVPAGAAAGPVFETGDLIISQPDFWTGGDITWHRGDGSLVTALDPGFQDVSGAEFDPSGRLWVISFQGNKAVALDSSGNLLGTIVDPIHEEPLGHPTDLSFDAKGNAYIGSFEFDGPIVKFSPSGESLGVLLDWEADHLDLSSDQCTLYFLDGNGGLIHRKDLCADGTIHTVPPTYAPDDPAESFGMRILPDGSLLVALPRDGFDADDSGVARINDDGNLLQVYDTPECAGGRWVGIALSPDASSFWSSCQIWPADPYPVEFDVASGDVIRTLSVDGAVQAVFGGFRAAQDRTDPTVSIVTPAQNATYTLGQPVAADYECADLGGSDLASCIGNVTDGAAIDTSSVGTKTFEVTAADGASNSASSSATYQVVYNFAGFFNPIDNPPTFNVMPAGKGVKLIFRLGGNQGLSIFEPGYPSASTVTCNPGAPQDKVEKFVKISSSKLTYEPKPNQYVYFWSTNNTWRGSCKQLALKLKDGTEHRALFKFT